MELDACVTPLLTAEDFSQLLKSKMGALTTDPQQVMAPMPVPLFPKLQLLSLLHGV